MDEIIKDDEILNPENSDIQESPETTEETENPEEPEGHSDFRPANRFDASAVHHLSGMYQNWFLDYASYVILERAVPHIGDGFKPVQRRILHSMKRMDDGRYNKVANIVGHTMQFHPHGDASIGDALVQMGQKDLLIDTQGNWGNILTGDRAAAPRYIEARLSKFALDVVFNPKTTDWQLSYDGRNKEPITLPAKFPLLLAQGAEGIAVGLSSKILPHNFNELCDAAIHYLKGEEFQLFPDFPTGGSIDVSKYNDGQRGGVLKVRAKIEKLDSKTLVIREIPYSKTTVSLIDSILKAIERGKIKAKRVDDNTAADVEIQVHLAPGVSSDKTIDALYAFSDCEINLSPNCCVIEDHKPKFLTVSDVLRHNVDTTMGLLRKELEIRKAELEEQLFFASLERIFIEERMYKDKKFENAENMDAVVAHLDQRLEPFKKDFIREVTRDDILRLMEIKMQRILKFNKDKAEELIARIKKEIAEIEHDLAHMVDVTIEWFTYIKEKYGKEHPRRTEIRNFDSIEAAKVIEATQKLYINRQEGFIGTGLKKDEFVCNCSDIDDIIIFYRDGHMKVVRVAEKLFVGKNIQHLQVFKKNDTRTTYNMVYRDGKNGPFYIKRFNVPAVTRDRDIDLTPGKPGTKIFYFTANPNGEAEVIKVTFDSILQMKSKNKKLFMERSFADIAIKGRGAKGNILTKNPVHRISLKSLGHSTLGGLKVWWDADVNRLNYDDHGVLLGEFFDEDQILVILKNGDYYCTNFDVNNHYEDSIERIEKYDPDKIWSMVLYDADNQGYPYVKRFMIEPTKNPKSLTGDNKNSEFKILTDQPYPRIRVNFGGADAWREPLEIEVEEFIAVKSSKAKGKRITTYAVESIEQLEPTRVPEPEPDDEPEGDEQDGETSVVETETAETEVEAQEVAAVESANTKENPVEIADEEKKVPTEDASKATAKSPETPEIESEETPVEKPKKASGGKRKKQQVADVEKIPVPDTDKTPVPNADKISVSKTADVPATETAKAPATKPAKSPKTSFVAPEAPDVAPVSEVSQSDETPAPKASVKKKATKKSAKSEAPKASEEAVPAVPESTPSAPESSPSAPESSPSVPESTPSVPESSPAASESDPAVQEPKPTAPMSKPASAKSRTAASKSKATTSKLKASVAPEPKVPASSNPEPAVTSEPAEEVKSPQFKYNPKTGELSLFDDDDM
ncbi:MAG: DNA gyrase/topoisomerase IV subunit A [Prevotella sp.]|nr:DNA gyrase/topoisomerase IV subunit A [Prevotella sp.]